MEGVTNTMAEFLTNIGTFFTTSIEWLGDVLSTITGNPALTVLVLAMPIIGFSVGLLKRLVKM